jgi:hypothetical protein
MLIARKTPGTGVTAQEITVGLLNHGVAAIPGD